MIFLRTLRPRHTTTSLQRASRGTPGPSTSPRFQTHNRRFQSNKPSPSDSSSATTAQANRISRILSRTSRFLPKRLQTSLQNLRSAPFSHVCAFLILHEVTAIVPVLGLTYTFYTLDWIPTGWSTGSEGKDKQESADGGAVLSQEEAKGDGEAEGEGWDGNKHGIAGSVPRAEAGGSAGNSTSMVLTGKTTEPTTATGNTSIAASEGDKVSAKAERSTGRKLNQYAVQMAAAYAITKFLLVPRVALSLWLTPWLARGFVGFRQALRRIRS